MGSDLDILVGHALGVPISIHAPAWGATPTHHAVTQPVLISIHAPAWGATRFSPLDKRLPTISIHAPAWGATVDIGLIHGRGHISIHAPAWGATQGNAARMVAYQFQSTLPHGERPDSRHSQDMSCYFNPRSRMGSDSRRWMDLRCAGFQSTLPHGERHPSPIRSTSTWNFNPRSRMGSDSDVTSDSRCNPISIHAPAWGATSTVLSPISSLIFQSTLPHGERLGRAF